MEKKLKTKVDIGSIRFGLSGKVSMSGIYIEDQDKDTMLAGGTIKARLNFLKLFRNDIIVKDIELSDVTARIKRLGTDSVFNFQYLVDAFTTKSVATDTIASAPLDLTLNSIKVHNSLVTVTDDMTGSNIFIKIGDLNLVIDSLNLGAQHYGLPSITLKNTEARITQYKLLVKTETVSDKLAEAGTPKPFFLALKDLDLTEIKLDYRNDVSALYSNFYIGKLTAKSKSFDFDKKVLQLDELTLSNSVSKILLGHSEGGKVVVKEVEKGAAIATRQGWDISIAKINLTDNDLQFDNDNKPQLSYGMDYAHVKVDSLNLNIDRFVMNADSIGGLITSGNFREKSGFVLNELRGDILYSYNQAYLKDLYIKTPGTELQRNALLEYGSYKALSQNFERTVMDIEFMDSYIQVKDLLTFAPQLRSQPAFRNPNDVWYLNFDVSGTLSRLNVEILEFDGLEDTQISASGILTGLSTSADARGTFTIHKLHTNKNDIALFSGRSIFQQPLELPHTYDISGTLAGNMNNLQTAMNINTSMGFVSVNGRFNSLSTPSATNYTANVRTNSLQLGRILRQRDMGALSANLAIEGNGLAGPSMKTDIRGSVNSFGYNKYTYRNIIVKSTVTSSTIDADIVSRDPNAGFTGNISGNIGAQPALRINGFIDSLKTLPLGFTATPLIVRGRIIASIPRVTPDDLDADILITDALFVAGRERLNLDSVHFVSGGTGASKFMRLHSDLGFAEVTGQYRLADLSFVIEDNINPYFTISKSTKRTLRPYDFTFRADLVYSPVMAALIPGFNGAEQIHTNGRIATNSGLTGSLNTTYLNFNNNQFTDLTIAINTTDSGMIVSGAVGRLQNASVDMYNISLNASALNNVLNFDAGVEDQAGREKYHLAGVLTQPSKGDVTIRLKPGAVVLNYESWTTAPNSSISIINNQLHANNFSLQRGQERISVNSTAGAGSPLDIGFTNFRIATITGFLKSDSLLLNGVMNGTARVTNVLTQPLFTANLNVADMSFRSDTLGNLAVKIDNAGNRYTTNATLTGRGNDLDITGSFAPVGKDVSLDLNLAIRKMDIATLEGAMKEFVSSASGSITGNVRVKGTMKNPDIQGRIAFDNATVSTLMLGGPLTIDKEFINVTNEGFSFNHFAIRDSAGHRLVLNGNVLTRNFVNYDFDLRVRAREFRILNTIKKKTDIYYGQVYITTNLAISGTEKAPVMDGSITVTDKTELSVLLPQAEPGVADREGVVEFVDFNSPLNDSLFRQYDSLNQSSLIGFDITTTIEIEKEAMFNIIVDAANGDFVNLQGEALLSAGIDPSGKISLVGPFEIEKGSYQLSFNFLQRKFNIEKGSKIVWLGDPTNAELDIRAIYEADIASLDLVADQIPAEQRNYYLQKLPFQVILTLGGEIMQPIISFDIDLPENRVYTVSGEVEATVRSRLAAIRREPSEINKQVFAVLLLGRFIGENPFASESGNSFDAKTFAKQSVSKLLTEQLNNLAAGMVQGVDINFDVASADDYSTGQKRTRTDLNVGLSKRLLNDRLTVTLGSNFQLGGQAVASNQASNNIAGNVSVNYMLSRDGRYMLRFYRRNEYEGMVDGYVVETGLGFLISVDYDKFTDILKSSRIRRQERRRQRDTEQQQKTQPPVNNAPGQ